MPVRIPCALLLAYDGSDFRGWQRQPGMPTVQEAIEEALTAALGKRTQIFGAARTDAGVHARGQVCHFIKEAIATESAARTLADALRPRLPPSIELRDAAIAHPSFHARASAIGKHYQYRFAWGDDGTASPRRASSTSTSTSTSTWTSTETETASAKETRTKTMAIERAGPRAFHLGASATPDWDRARAALDGLRTLAALPGLSSPSSDRRPAPPLTAATLSLDGPTCVLSVSAEAFRKHEVRNLAGHLAAIALSLAAPESLALLAARTRPWMGACAPPHGLTLTRVDYPRELDPFLPLASIDAV